jgi:hypothetical protein
MNRLFYTLDAALLLVSGLAASPVWAEDFYYTSIDPADGGSPFPGVVTCFTNGSLTNTVCGATNALPNSDFLNVDTVYPCSNSPTGGCAAGAVVLGSDGQPYVNAADQGRSTTLTPIQSVRVQAFGLVYFSGATVYQESGRTQNVTINVYSQFTAPADPANLLSSTTVPVPSGVATPITTESTLLYLVEIVFPTLTVFGANHFQVSAIPPATVGLTSSANCQFAAATPTAP